jgi:hypothetical protein
MAGMFSPKKGEPETPEVSPLKIEMEVPPVVVPAKSKGERIVMEIKGGRNSHGRKEFLIIVVGSGGQLALLQIPSLERAARN